MRLEEWPILIELEDAISFTRKYSSGHHPFQYFYTELYYEGAYPMMRNSMGAHTLYWGYKSYAEISYEGAHLRLMNS